MSDKDVAAEQGPAEQEPGARAPEAPAAVQPKSREPFIPPGPVSTQELRARARRRREAEEKLQQHVVRSKEKPARE